MAAQKVLLDDSSRWVPSCSNELSPFFGWRSLSVDFVEVDALRLILCPEAWQLQSKSVNTKETVTVLGFRENMICTLVANVV
jgi:hypothetical protein